MSNVAGATTVAELASALAYRQQESAIVAEKIEVLNQHDQVVLACEHLYLVERRAQLNVTSNE